MKNEMKLNFVKEYVKNTLSNYLEFDVDEIYNTSDYGYIFGGAIRDSIVNDDINDIDILCLPNSRSKISGLLKGNGYIKKDFYKKGVYDLYKDIKVIFTPLTFMKGEKNIQLITPKGQSGNVENTIINNFFDILTNVDLSSSGLYFDGYNIKESYANAMVDVFSKVYRINRNAKMYNPDRFELRKYKLEERGWKHYEESTLSFMEENRKKFIKIIERENNIKEFMYGISF